MRRPLSWSSPKTRPSIQRTTTTPSAEAGGVKLKRDYKLDAPKGVRGRNSDNTKIKQLLGWEPSIPLRDGMAKTYAWIEQQYKDRKAGKPTVS